MDKTTTELIEWCRFESNRNAAMQGDKDHQTNRRRKTFRYRNHMFTELANRLEEAEHQLRDIEANLTCCEHRECKCCTHVQAILNRSNDDA